MLVAAAVCPCPPLLVPEVASGAAPELDALRAASADAVAVLAASRPDLLIVVGPAEETQEGICTAGTVGSFRGFGVDLGVRLGEAGGGADNDNDNGNGNGNGNGDGNGAEAGREGVSGNNGSRRTLPPSLAVAAWLLDRARWAAAPVEGLGVGESPTPDQCMAAGRGLAARAGRVALLAMGDGSACRTLKAPGYLDERAVDFDRRAADALGCADLDGLKALDVSQARELKVSGRAPWQVLAGAGEGAGLEGRLLREDAPYGVGYFVAAWS
ncbi:class III extradiol dioxygenase subunit B-like domain-containing protein [Streptomyces sp. NPDC003023]|uniref:class III extradiol dioxygenase subunit B-like domain-containing protein n=1 Tax=Streptomyces sp. NPDC003023 TaxID=3364675 RepID=UPI0036A82633